MPQNDDLHVSSIVFIGTLAVILTVVAIFAAQALYFNYANFETQRKVILAPTPDSDSRLAEEEAKLARYSWVDREAEIVTIPIERAMELVVNELRDTPTGHDRVRAADAGQEGDSP